MKTTRRGFTLIELLVAMLLLAIVGSAMYKMLINTQRLSRRQAERSDLQDDVRAGALIVPAELREIGYDDNGVVANPDLLEMAANYVRFRAMRGVGFTCSVTGTELYLRLPLLGYSQTPAVGDQILVFADDDEAVAFDDRWMPLAVAAVNSAAVCPGGGAALKLTVGAVPIQVRVGGPVRFFDQLQMGLYAADGKSWLGVRSWSAGNASYQPVLGPLRDGDGLKFTYYNAADVEVPVTGDRNAVRTIQIELQGRSDGPVWLGTGGQKIDTLYLKTRVALRNALRP